MLPLKNALLRIINLNRSTYMAVTTPLRKTHILKEVSTVAHDYTITNSHHTARIESLLVNRYPSIQRYINTDLMG